MRVAIGSDHAGFPLKRDLTHLLVRLGHETIDVGTSSDEVVDYPIFAHAVGRLVASGVADRGIVVDGAGIGSAIAANKVGHVRAVLAYDLSSARNSREHNNANVLTLGARMIGSGLALEIVALWLSAHCTEERHLRRVDLIRSIETGSLPLPDEVQRLIGTDTSLAQCPEDSGELSTQDLDRIALRLDQILGQNTSVRPNPIEAATASPVAHSPDAARRYLDFGVARLSSAPPAGDVPRDIARRIDHTLLRADATSEQIRKLCAEAHARGFATVCVNPVWVALAARELTDSETVVCSVVGFPLGASTSQIKALEARRAIRDGAREIDMVMQIGALKSGETDLVLDDVRLVVEECRDRGVVCKMILETALLSDDEKRTACRLARRGRADFVKTSTGFGPGGATAHDVALMAAEVRGAGMGVKAAGGIRSYAAAAALLAAGATRIGASASLAIVAEAATTESARTESSREHAWPQSGAGGE